MKHLLLLLLIIPSISYSQINRSATELAQENIQEYITAKLFPGTSYRAIGFGILTAEEKKDPKIIWMIEHKFQITATRNESGRLVAVRELHRLMFYLDKRMNICRAESYFR